MDEYIVEGKPILEKAIVEPKVIKLCRRIEPILIRQEKKMKGNERHMIDEKIVNVYMNFQKISL